MNYQYVLYLSSMVCRRVIDDDDNDQEDHRKLPAYRGKNYIHFSLKKGRAIFRSK